MRIRLRSLAVAVLALAMVGIGAAALVTYLGVYDISATKQHTRPVFALLDYAMRRSVQARAEAAAPPDLERTGRVLGGAALYRTHCLQCHGAPGVAPDALAFGLRPAPANLLAAGRDWSPGEIFWVVKHGIKMTGMPAWTLRLSDEQIWDVVAFVRTMPKLSPGDYAALAPGPPRSRSMPAADAGVQLRPGDVQAGRIAVAQHLCATCHTIPGIVGAAHHVGPPLAGMGGRAFIGGVIPNTPDNMVRWLLDPQKIDPLSAMPPLGLSPQDAKDITAFLATLDRVEDK